MKILAIDSSAVCGSACILDGTKRLFESFINTTHTHSKTLLSMIESALLRAEISIDDIDAFACTVGPGSFTGIRIGVSLIKGLAFSKNKPCIGVSTLEAAAYQLKGIKGLIVPVSDARRCGVYNALFYSDGDSITRLTPDRLTLACELIGEIKSEANKRHTNVYFVGDGYDRIYREAAAVCGRVKPIPEALKFQSAYSVGALAYEIYSAAEDKSIYTDELLAAKYLRAAQAERERLERLGFKTDN